MKKIYLKILICLLFILTMYYFMLPPLNLSAPSFWLFIYIVIIFCMSVWFTLSIPEKLQTIINNRKVSKDKKWGFLLLTFFATILIIILINLINSPMFSSKSYYNRINISDGDFTKDVEKVDFNKLALIDKDSSSKLGDRVMGQMTDLVSQFYVSNLYTQINYNDSIIRVTPLEYSGFIKYLTNRKNGVSGYITVNSVTGESKLVRLEKGMKYMPSAVFFEDLCRKLRISYPTLIFGDINFEIDDSGKPYWIAEVIKYTGIGLKKEVSGIVVLDPVDGSSVRYLINEIPEWIDHVYSSKLIIEQVNDWGKYKNGFLNSIFGQKNVVMTTTGYNYLVMNNDIYLYTGITSVSSDESNIGFILTNLRTKETKFYNVAGAEEYSAMASAEGQVQQMKYTSTFPLLINLDGKPTYLLSLKDNAGLVKMYAFVDYVDYQKVVTSDSSKGIIEAAKNYLGGSISSDTVDAKIVVTAIQTASIDGTTYYYIKDKNNTYRISIKINEKILPFIKIGDELKIKYKESEINEIIEVEK